MSNRYSVKIEHCRLINNPKGHVYVWAVLTNRGGCMASGMADSKQEAQEVAETKRSQLELQFEAELAIA